MRWWYLNLRCRRRPVEHLDVQAGAHLRAHRRSQTGTDSNG
jgi:hypothetical protein